MSKATQVNLLGGRWSQMDNTAKKGWSGRAVDFGQAGMTEAEARP